MNKNNNKKKENKMTCDMGSATDSKTVRLCGVKQG